MLDLAKLIIYNIQKEKKNDDFRELFGRTFGNLRSQIFGRWDKVKDSHFD